MLFDMTANSNSGRKLMVLDPEYPKDVSVFAINGQTAIASFEAKISEHGKPAEYTYQWYVNGTPVEGATSVIYTREVSESSNSEKVYCAVTNKKGTLHTRVADLSVFRVLDDSLHDQTVARGTEVTCNVSIAGSGSPASCTYQWYRDGKPVEGKTKASYTFEMTGIGRTEVYCEVTNSAGTVTTRTATIKEYYDIVPNKSILWNSSKTTVSKTVKETVFKSNVTNVPSYASCTVDVTPYNVMHLTFNGNVDGADSSDILTFSYGIFSNEGSLIAGGYYERNDFDRSFSIDQDYDISTFEGNQYISFGFVSKRNDGAGATFTVTKVRLEG